MPRKARITVAGAIHHILARGNEGRRIFIRDEDRDFFLRNLEQYLQRSGYLLTGELVMRTLLRPLSGSATGKFYFAK